MIIPARAPSFSEALRVGAEVFHELRYTLLASGRGVAIGSDGGFAPDLVKRARAPDAGRRNGAAGYERDGTCGSGSTPRRASFASTAATRWRTSRQLSAVDLAAYYERAPGVHAPCAEASPTARRRRRRRGRRTSSSSASSSSAFACCSYANALSRSPLHGKPEHTERPLHCWRCAALDRRRLRPARRRRAARRSGSSGAPCRRDNPPVHGLTDTPGLSRCSSGRRRRRDTCSGTRVSHKSVRAV